MARAVRALVVALTIVLSGYVLVAPTFEINRGATNERGADRSSYEYALHSSSAPNTRLVSTDFPALQSHENPTRSAVVAAHLPSAAPVVAAETGGWTLPEAGGGAEINGRWYTEHALERMAPDTPQIRAELEARALGRAEAAGLKPGTPAFGDWWNSYGPDPRGVPPSVVESEIANPGSTGVRVITGGDGRVVTVIPR